MLKFKKLGKPEDISHRDWKSWKWQLRYLKDSSVLSKKTLFLTGATPYYNRLVKTHPFLKLVAESSKKEEKSGVQSMKDPLGEADYSPFSRLIHRYPDRVLLLATDQCGVYCRYCTRKRFTGRQKAFVSKEEQKKIFSYIYSNKGIREVILSGGDPLTLSDSLLDNLLSGLREIPHIEIIRIASRMPTACPMRMTDSLCRILKKNQPVFLMLHFNHPVELTQEAQESLNRVSDSGILMFNQTVLLKGLNNHPAVIQALVRRLLYLRVKPYYMFQCDPSEGTDHLRTSIENSKWIQKELWGRLSGLALPNLSLDIPGGGGKVGLAPDFCVNKKKKEWLFEGWDGVKGAYKNPETYFFKAGEAYELEEYQKEWEDFKKTKIWKK